MVIIILVSVGVGASAMQILDPAVNHMAIPPMDNSWAYPFSTNSTNHTNSTNSTNLTGIAGQVWNATWPSLSGIATYFENITGRLFNDTMIWFTWIMQNWTAAISGFGLWSFPLLAVVLGVMFIGVSLTLAVGDAARDVVEG
jgi:hypothetical protein